ncbi:MAG: proline--tRNA ligase [Proteobacteria bacterium]|jgi:prolyl-tRNA synthetase|nr:proline--tRNA ligase [Pseudomonadota bacterium]
MRLSQGFWQTLKETPNDAEIPSHQLMMRAGLIHKTAGGLYTYLPMAFRSLKKIEKIIREEHDRIGCFEIQMPVVTPAELWKETGRWDVMGPQMLRIKDRAERELCVSPTNEESVTDVFRKTINSYKQLPVCLYQINTKFRDEIRPRFGLLRGREFTMKDGYSLHMDKDCLDTFYQKIYGAYVAIFKRMGLDFIVVEADGGAMAAGGAKTHEFQLIADAGEDTLVTVPGTGYAANIEKAPTTRLNLKPQPTADYNEFATPNQKTCEEVAAAHGLHITHTLKSLVMQVIRGEKVHYYMVMLLGDDQLNEVKFKNAMNADHVRAAQAGELEALGLIKGFMGPTHQAEKLSVLFDACVDLNSSYVVGANKEGFHAKGFVPSRDTKLSFKQLDLRLAKDGDVMNGQPIVMKKGIEVGHVFQLGDKYTKSMGATVLNAQGKAITPLMGCYGIGVTRTLAASIEQSHDQDGIIWPAAIAPYDIYFGVIAKTDETKKIAEEIYESFLKAGLEVLYDDRGMGPGGMFKDADLIGLPLRVVLGERDFNATGEIEVKVRKTGETLKLKREALVGTIKEKLQTLGKWA